MFMSRAASVQIALCIPISNVFMYVCVCVHGRCLLFAVCDRCTLIIISACIDRVTQFRHKQCISTWNLLHNIFFLSSILTARRLKMMIAQPARPVELHSRNQFNNYYSIILNVVEERRGKAIVVRMVYNDAGNCDRWESIRYWLIVEVLWV